MKNLNKFRNYITKNNKKTKTLLLKEQDLELKKTDHNISGLFIASIERQMESYQIRFKYINFTKKNDKKYFK